MDRLDQCLDVFELSENVGVLEHDGSGIVGEGGREARWIDDSSRPRDRDQLGLQVLHRGRRDLPVLRMDSLRDDDAAEPPGNGQRHEQRLADGRAPVVQAGVGDVHPGQLSNQGLIFKGCLQGPLACLRLVGCIGRVELASRGKVIHDCRDEVIVAACPQEADPLVGSLIAGE